MSSESIPESKQRPFPEPAEFIFNEPLYEQLVIAENFGQFLSLHHDRLKIDGFCPVCGVDRVFTTEPPAFIQNILPRLVESISPPVGLYTVTAACAKNNTHRIAVYYRLTEKTIEKVGQSPSLATLLLKELKPLRGAIAKVDGEELHKAIGLATHGVGVGSFVYLRRVFERLIAKCYAENQATLPAHPDFGSIRMPDKIDILKAHLPALLVEHRKIYGILSKGLHELTEEECKGYFRALKQAIFLILRQEDEKKRRRLDEEELRKTLAAMGTDASASDTGGTE